MICENHKQSAFNHFFKILGKLSFIIFFIVLSTFSYAQSVSFEDFLILSKDYLNQNALEDIRELLPEEFLITAEDIGDFSGDGVNDFAIAVSPKRNRAKEIYIYLFCDSLNSYVNIFSDTLKYFELPIEIGFSISKNVCYITQKIKDRSWNIAGYSFNRNEFSYYDIYKTDVVALPRKVEVGEENYLNYNDMKGFTGFFDLSNINQLRKSNYFIFPVYNQQRNIYKGYKHKFNLDNNWYWDSTKSPMSIGNFRISYLDESLLVEIKLDNLVFENLDFNRENSLAFYFDRSGDKLLRSNTRLLKRTPNFRDKLDDNVGGITISLRESNKDIIRISLPESYNKEEIKGIKFNKPSKGVYQLKIPLSILEFSEVKNEISCFIQMTLSTGDNSYILKSGDGSMDDPASYGKMIFIPDGKYHNIVKNLKFSQFIDKFNLNGLKHEKIIYLP